MLQDRNVGSWKRPSEPIDPVGEHRFARAGITASGNGHAFASDISRRSSWAVAVASSSRHHSVAARSASCQRSSSATRSGHPAVVAEAILEQMAHRRIISPVARQLKTCGGATANSPDAAISSAIAAAVRRAAPAVSIVIVFGPRGDRASRSRGRAAPGDSSHSRTSSTAPRSASRSARKPARFRAPRRTARGPRRARAARISSTGVVSGLTDRDAATSQQAGKIVPKAFEAYTRR